MPNPNLTCIHAAHGLCPSCRADYEEDALGYLEFGDHPEGLRRWRELQAELLADTARPQVDAVPSEIPF